LEFVRIEAPSPEGRQMNSASTIAAFTAMASAADACRESQKRKEPAHFIIQLIFSTQQSAF
jgi:hypothetical protein